MPFVFSLFFIFAYFFENQAQDFSAIENCQNDLMRDLIIVDYWNNKIHETLPVTYNHFLQGGYINMPSARMGAEGEIGFGYSRVPPYINYNLRVQLTKRLEIAGNYRIFQGVQDPHLSKYGFGDLSDKGANVKFAIFTPEDSQYKLPGIALGFEDFIGTQSFKARYIVLTQVLLNYNMEISLGYGQQRIRHWFGGMSWMPFRQWQGSYLQGLSLVTEYDATPYKRKKIELHPKGRKQKTPFNFGIKYRLYDFLDFSLSYVRGEKLAFSAACFYNFGYTHGFIPKIDNPLPYTTPINTQPLGDWRSENTLVQDLIYPLEDQGFDLLQVWLSHDDQAQKILRLRVLNNNCRTETVVRDRLNHIITALIPSDIDQVIIVIESEGFPLQEYCYFMEYVRRFSRQEMGVQELNLLTNLREVTYPDPERSTLLFKDRRNLYNFEFFPKVHALFGSSKGKFKYALGVQVGLNGFIYGDVYYSALIGLNAVNNLHGLSGIDRLNPSTLINVRTDTIRYYKQRGISFDALFIQKNWNMGRGWYAKLATGLFEDAYGGLAGECLYYPVKSCWAVGFETAYLRKRSYKGLGFSDRVRKLDGFKAHYEKFVGKQYFLNFYYNLANCELDFKVKVGKFLANDWGAQFEISRYFESGLRLGIWYTLTNGHDRINGQTYHDKGISFSMPLDIFYTHSERDRFGEGMAAWLRDVGAIGSTGLGLFNLIRLERE